MKQQSTFTDWEFIDVWDIGENQTYPFLRTHSADDVNKDGIVDFLDLCIIAEQWMEECQSLPRLRPCGAYCGLSDSDDTY
jgi:hypothetical protein